jgi:hypothetical protein
MGTDPVSPDLPLVEPMTADEKVDHINNMRAALQAATIQRDTHVQMTNEEIRNKQLDDEMASLALQLEAVQSEASDRGIELTGIAAMKAAAAVVPDSGQPVREVVMNDGAVLAESGMGADEAPVEAAVAETPVVEPTVDHASESLNMDITDESGVSE